MQGVKKKRGLKAGFLGADPVVMHPGFPAGLLSGGVEKQPVRLGLTVEAAGDMRDAAGGVRAKLRCLRRAVP